MIILAPLFSATGVGPATWVELVWLTVGIISFYHMLLLFMAALGDYEFVMREGLNGSRIIVARTSVFTVGAKLIVLGGYGIIGLAASLTRPANPNQPITLLGLIITGCFLVGAFALSASAIIQRRARNQIMEKEAQRDLDERWTGFDVRSEGQQKRYDKTEQGMADIRELEDDVFASKSDHRLDTNQ